MKKKTFPIFSFLSGTIIGISSWVLSFTPVHACSIMPILQPDTLIVKGTVQTVNDYTKNTEALPGTTIMIKGARTGVVSGTNGDFQFRDVSERDTFTLVFSFVGYFNKEITIINRHTENEMDLGNVMMNPRPAGDPIIFCPPVKGIKRHKRKH